MAEDRKSHWDNVYASKPATAVSWYEPHPAESLALIDEAGVRHDEPIIDVGAGASLLVDELLRRGFRDLTVLDVSARALHGLRERLGRSAAGVTFLECDVTQFHPTRTYTLWHDRAVFHFLVSAEDRRKYRETLSAALIPGGHAVIATFGPSGPDRCSGLPTDRYDAAAIAKDFSGLQLVDSRLALHHTPWGAPQQFLHCLLRRGAGR
jgi:trans-aconitate methyltransferase